MTRENQSAPNIFDDQIEGLGNFDQNDQSIKPIIDILFEKPTDQASQLSQKVFGLVEDSLNQYSQALELEQNPDNLKRAKEILLADFKQFGLIDEDNARQAGFDSSPLEEISRQKNPSLFVFADSVIEFLNDPQDRQNWQKITEKFAASIKEGEKSLAECNQFIEELAQTNNPQQTEDLQTVNPQTSENSTTQDSITEDPILETATPEQPQEDPILETATPEQLQPAPTVSLALQNLAKTCKKVLTARLNDPKIALQEAANSLSENYQRLPQAIKWFLKLIDMVFGTEITKQKSIPSQPESPKQGKVTTDQNNLVSDYQKNPTKTDTFETKTDKPEATYKEQLSEETPAANVPYGKMAAILNLLDPKEDSDEYFTKKYPYIQFHREEINALIDKLEEEKGTTLTKEEKKNIFTAMNEIQKAVRFDNKQQDNMAGMYQGFGMEFTPEPYYQFNLKDVFSAALEKISSNPQKLNCSLEDLNALKNKFLNADLKAPESSQEAQVSADLKAPESGQEAQVNDESNQSPGEMYQEIRNRASEDLHLLTEDLEKLRESLHRETPEQKTAAPASLTDLIRSSIMDNLPEITSDKTKSRRDLAPTPELSAEDKRRLAELGIESPKDLAKRMQQEAEKTEKFASWVEKMGYNKYSPQAVPYSPKNNQGNEPETGQESNMGKTSRSR